MNIGGDNLAGITLKGVTKTYGSQSVLNDINLDIADGEFLTLVGPSGCGKSTTLRIIAGLETQSTGDVFIDGSTVNETRPSKRDLAMVFQSYALYPHLTVHQNLITPLKLRDLTALERVPLFGHLMPERSKKMSTISAEVHKVAEILKIEPLLDRKPGQLSGGQRQRVALGRAMVRDPAAFLMDEPLSNLDAKLRVSTRAQIKHLQNKLKITTIYVTHDQVEAMTLADRVVVMNNGKIQQIGSPKEIYNRPFNTFVASFIGSPPMNLIPISIRNKTSISQDLKFSKINVKDGKYTLGFRAEDASIEKTGNFTGPIYSIELLGDSTIVTLNIKNNLLHIKTSNNFSSKIGEIVSVKIPNSLCHFFDSKTGIHL